MEDVVFQLVSLVVLSVSLGLVLGVLFTRGGYRRKLESLHREKEAEFKAEKTEISRELGAELARIRESIVQTVDAYEAAVQVLEDRLPNPEEQHLRLEVKVAAPLAVEYKRELSPSALGGRGGLRRVLQADDVTHAIVSDCNEAAQAGESFEQSDSESSAASGPAVVSVEDASDYSTNGAGVNGHGEHAKHESAPNDLQEEMYGQTEPDEGFSAIKHETPNGHEKSAELGKSHQ